MDITAECKHDLDTIRTAAGKIDKDAPKQQSIDDAQLLIAQFSAKYGLSRMITGIQHETNHAQATYLLPSFFWVDS